MVHDTRDIPSRGKAQTASRGAKEFGQALKTEFPFDPEWRNLNNGTYLSVDSCTTIEI